MFACILVTVDTPVVADDIKWIYRDLTDRIKKDLQEAKLQAKLPTFEK